MRAARVRAARVRAAAAGAIEKQVNNHEYENSKRPLLDDKR